MEIGKEGSCITGNDDATQYLLQWHICSFPTGY